MSLTPENSSSGWPSFGGALHVLGDRIADWSDLGERPFWRKMEKNSYCWPIDADGNRRPFAAIPHHVGELSDNVWRSLARRVRGGAFAD